LLTQIDPGTSLGSIRNRISSLRVKQRNLYESLGWELPDGGATSRKRAAGDDGEGTPVKKARAKKGETPSKRGGDGDDEGTPVKKARANKVKKDEEIEMGEEEGGGDGDGEGSEDIGGVGVKEEDFEA
jgi:hypothetical protein